MDQVYEVIKIIPISEERVACEASRRNGNKVIILDTTSGEIMSTIPSGYRMLVACNSKCQLLTYNHCSSLKLSDGKTTLWKTNLTVVNTYDVNVVRFGMFSRAEQFVVVCKYGKITPPTLLVLNAVSGETLHILWKGERYYSFFDCKFVSDEECVISSASVGYCLHLFNVKSGDLLSVIHLENEVKRLTACPRKRLLAIGHSDFNGGFKLIQVWLPQDKNSKKNKRMAKTPEIEERKKNDRMANTLENQESRMSKRMAHTQDL
ncbi:hypothetical protein ACROYT_G031004 [Oculina patagonica]